MQTIDTPTTHPIRSLRFWALASLGAIVVGIVLSEAFGKSGDGNDPFLAELGNIAQLVAVAVLLTVGVIAGVRAVRGRGSA